MNRRVRRVSISLVAMLALLLSQVAVSAHFCAMSSPAEPLAQVAVDGPCPEMAIAANLCAQHCQFGHSVVDQGKPLPTLDLTLGSGLLVVSPFARVALAQRPAREPPLPPEAPPAIRFSALRI